MADKLADLVLEFLEAVVHETLFAWQVYPLESFQRATLYNVPMHMSRHPLLCEYIHSALRGCREWILGAELDKLSVIALSESGRTIKTLVIQPVVEPPVVDTGSSEQEVPLPLVQLEEIFRTALVAIVSSSLIAGDSDEGGKPATFRILAHTLEDSAQPLTSVDSANAANSWVIDDHTRRGEMSRQHSVFPVKSAHSADCPVRINMYLETPE